jgi:hypothetical protein
MLDFEFLQEQNFSPNGWGDQQLVYELIFADINAGGGINGRTIEAAYAFYSPLGTVEAEEACVQMTQDEEVFVVVGGFLGPAEAANACITGTNETALVGGTITDEFLAQASAPWVDFRPSQNDLSKALLTLLDGQGLTTGARVFIATLIGGEANTEDAVKPRLADLGIEVVGEAVLDIPDGDTAAQDQAMAVISEAIRASGANTVLISGGVSAIVRGMGNEGLIGDIDQIWATHADHLANLGETVSNELADGVITVDRLSDNEAWVDPLMLECRTVVEAGLPADLVVLDPEDQVDGAEDWGASIRSYCSRAHLFVVVMTAAGVNPTNETFQAAVDALGQFSLPGVPNASLGPGKYGADDSFRLSVYDSTVGEGDLVPLTDILDATP